MALDASFSIEGLSTRQAYEVAYGATVDLAVLSLTGASIISWSIDSVSHESMTSPTITSAGSPTGATASFPMPSDPGDGQGRACVVKLLLTDSGGNTAVDYRLVGVPNTRGIVPLCPGESLARHASRGWSDVINECISAPTTAPEVASDTTAATLATAAYSFPFTTANKKALVKYLITAKEQTDNIYYTHVAYVEVWNDGSALQIIGTPSIVINGAHSSTGAAATVEFSVAYTESTTNLVATLTNSTNNTADVRFHPTIEMIWDASP